MAFKIDDIKKPEQLPQFKASIGSYLERIEDYRRHIEGLDFEQLTAEFNHQLKGGRYCRADVCKKVGVRKGWDKGPLRPTCWERIMGEDWC